MNFRSIDTVRTAASRIGPAQTRGRPAVGGWVRRLLLIALVALVGLYFSGALAGYLWVRYGRKNEHITFVDVMLLRWREVRRNLAAQQFAEAKREAAAGNLQAAFLAYTFAVNNDSANTDGRLDAVEFLKKIGSAAMAATMLETGLSRDPDNSKLIEVTFETLTSMGRDRRVLELLRERGGRGRSDANRVMLFNYELLATLNLNEPQAAKALLEKNADLENEPRVAAVVARVHWENQARLRGLDLLSKHVASSRSTLADFAQLVSWQLAISQHDDAVETSQLAVSRFSGDSRAELLLIEALGVRSRASPEWEAAVQGYVRSSKDRSAALLELGALSARRGWVPLSGSLYEMAAMNQVNLGLMASFYSDALVKAGRFKDSWAVLSQVEAQSAEASTPFVVQLRHRQVVTAAALGDMTAVREHARRLRTLLRNDPDGLEVSRRHFLQSGLTQAVSELSGQPATTVAASN